jgi:hypothetical protein
MSEERGRTYREVDDVDQLKATIVALEKDHARLQWQLIQMGQLCQHLGGRPRDAYKRRVHPLWIASALVSFTAMLLWCAAYLTNVTGCAG